MSKASREETPLAAAIETYRKQRISDLTVCLEDPVQIFSRVLRRRSQSQPGESRRTGKRLAGVIRPNQVVQLVPVGELLGRGS
jgi:hypothetical protein